MITIASETDRALAGGLRANGRGGRIMAEGPQPSGARAEAHRVVRVPPASPPPLSLVNGGAQPGRLHEGYLARFVRVLLDPDRTARAALVAEMRAAGVPWEDFADLYIPEAARRLGALWCEDGLGFADVTIGTARLQAMLRDTLPDPAPLRRRGAEAPGILVAVRQDEQHTLGAMVAAARLRRAGVSVRLALGQSDAEILRLMAGRAHDALFLSASGRGTLDSLRDLVERVRAVIGPAVPIVLGGSILLTESDLKARTGVDHAVGDPIEALRLCGLTLPQRRSAAADLAS